MRKYCFLKLKNYLISKGSVGLCFISGCISGCILGCISAFLQIKKIPIPAAPISTQSGKKVLINIHCHWGSRRWLLRGLFCYSDWLVFGLSLLSLGLISITPPGFRTLLTSRDTHQVLHFLWSFSLGPFSLGPFSGFLSFLRFLRFLRFLSFRDFLGLHFYLWHFYFC